MSRLHITYQWIKSTDSLPPEPGYYIVFGSYTRDCPKKVCEAYYDHKRKRFYQQGTISKNVTHWMPLPQKPQ